jgi:hypothetical protein
MDLRVLYKIGIKEKIMNIILSLLKQILKFVKLVGNQKSLKEVLTLKNHRKLLLEN